MPRWVTLLVVVAACKRAGETSTTPLPSLDIPHDAAVAGDDVPPPQPQLGLVFEPLDGPPASAPTGTPVQIKFVPAAAGATRTRTQTHEAIYHSVFPDKTPERLQETLITFVMREEILSVSSNRVKRMRVTVDRADELLVMNGERHVQPLLEGTYTVEIGGLAPQDIKMSSPGRVMGTREEEELSMLISADAASTTPFHDLVWQHPLRVGEAVVLTEAETKTLLAGDKTPGTITFSLRKLENGAATYQLDTAFDNDGEKRVVRQIHKLEVATGRMLEVVDATTSAEVSQYMTHENKQQTTIKFAW